MHLLINFLLTMFINKFTTFLSKISVKLCFFDTFLRHFFCKKGKNTKMKILKYHKIVRHLCIINKNRRRDF